MSLPAAGLGLGWAVLVLTLAHALGPLPAAIRALRRHDHSSRTFGEIGRSATESTKSSGEAGGGGPLALVGRAVAGAAARLGRRPRPHPDPPRDRRLGMTVVAAALALLAGPLMVPFAAGAAWVWPVWQRRRAERARLAALEADLPDVVDLLVLAVGAGCNVAQAVAAVGRRGTGPLACLLAQASLETAHGRRLTDALEGVAQTAGPAVHPLTSALVAGERYGVPLVDGLERLSTDVRAQHRRRCEAAARRVPVQLLFPLVTCILPAFALLTVAPLIASAISGLRL